MKSSNESLSDFGVDKSLSRSKDRHSATDAMPSEAKRVRKRRPNDTQFEDQTIIPEWVSDKYPDHSFCWENDEKQKVQKREARDWEIVRDASGSPVTQPGGRAETTDNVTMILMAIPTEWFEEDNHKSEEAILERTNSLRREAEGGSTYEARLPSESRRR